MFHEQRIYLDECWRAQTKMTEGMRRLVDAGYPREEMDHHYTDLYVYVNEISRPVIEQWCAEHGWRKIEIVKQKLEDIVEGGDRRIAVE